jgi:hypothetical protein
MTSRRHKPRGAAARDESQMPRSLARRPRWKGKYPIPYVMFIDDRGRPDFRVNDEAKRIQAINHRLCALCGQPLSHRQSAFIGGPKCERYRLFIDGPMHEGCAGYAFTMCPYLAAPGARHAEPAVLSARHSGEAVAVDGLASSARPERMGLFLARDWRIVRLAGQPGLYFYVEKFTRIEWRP